MKVKLMVVLLATLAASPVLAGEKVFSLAAAGYDSHDKAMLPHAFITGVDSWLRRYDHKLVTSERNHVVMRVNYAFLYDVELYVTPGEFQVLVTLAEDPVRRQQAKSTADKLSAGILKAMQKSLARSRRIRDGRR